MLLPDRQRALQKIMQSKSLDEFQCQPRAAELPTVLDKARLGARFREQLWLSIGWLRGDRLLHTQPASLIHQSQVRHRTLPRPTFRAIRLDQGPIGFTLTIAPTVVGSKEHSRILATIKSTSFHYTP